MTNAEAAQVWTEFATGQESGVVFHLRRKYGVGVRSETSLSSCTFTSF